MRKLRVKAKAKDDKGEETLLFKYLNEKCLKEINMKSFFFHEIL